VQLLAKDLPQYLRGDGSLVADESCAQRLVDESLVSPSYALCLLAERLIGLPADIMHIQYACGNDMAAEGGTSADECREGSPGRPGDRPESYNKQDPY
jgi:hypothetical protein